jgi:hypothetical protein
MTAVVQASPRSGKVASVDRRLGGFAAFSLTPHHGADLSSPGGGSVRP